MQLSIASSCIFAVAFLTTPPKIVEEFPAKVIGVTDGDTVTVLRGREQIKIRLEGIDAPERGQAFADKSKSALSKLVYRKSITIQKTGEDRYGRTLGRIQVAGRDAAEEMIKQGMAWHYKDYSTDEVLAELEVQARAAKIGLWSESNALAPWEYRLRQKNYSPPIESTGARPETEASPPGSYWLNTSSNTRHNAGCQYYNNTKRGRSCTASEGKACGKCGG